MSGALPTKPRGNDCQAPLEVNADCQVAARSPLNPGRCNQIGLCNLSSCARSSMDVGRINVEPLTLTKVGKMISVLKEFCHCCSVTKFED